MFISDAGPRSVEGTKKFKREERAMKMVAVLAGCGGLVFLVIGYQARLSQGSSGEHDETPTEQVKPPPAPFPQALTPACQGQPVPQAAEYKSGNGAHPFVFYQ